MRDVDLDPTEGLIYDTFYDALTILDRLSNPILTVAAGLDSHFH